MFRLEIQTSNAAFEDNPAEEIMRIITGKLFDHWTNGSMPLMNAKVGGTLRDSNGNLVGSWEYIPE